MRLGLREANQHFSKAIKAVRGGREVTLTERGRPIAVIVPIDDDHSPQAALRSMVDEGLIKLARKAGPTPAPRWRAVKIKGRPFSETIIEDRTDRL